MKQKLAKAADHHILFLPYAIKQMSRPGRLITKDEAR